VDKLPFQDPETLLDMRGKCNSTNEFRIISNMKSGVRISDSHNFRSATLTQLSQITTKKESVAITSTSNKRFFSSSPREAVRHILHQHSENKILTLHKPYRHNVSSFIPLINVNYKHTASKNVVEKNKLLNNIESNFNVKLSNFLSNVSSILYENKDDLHKAQLTIEQN
jgi:hypothetical protein